MSCSKCWGVIFLLGSFIVSAALEQTGSLPASVVKPSVLEHLTEGVNKEFPKVEGNQLTVDKSQDEQQQENAVVEEEAKQETPVEGLVHRWLHWGGNIHDRLQMGVLQHVSKGPASEIQNKLTEGQGEDSPPQIASYIAGAWNSNQTNHFPMDYTIQMMHRAEVDLISSYLRPTDVYVEYGSGGSTINFSPLVARAYSVEHNCEWADYITRLVREHVHHAAYTNLNIHCVSITPGFREWGTHSFYEHANYKQFREYVDAIDTFKEPSFDRVFIDGRARLACALKVLPYLKPDSLVFIHDFFSRTNLYGAVLQYYDEIARVLAVRNDDPTLGPIDEPQGLIVLRRSDDRNITPPTTEQIDAIYDSIDWRVPFGPPLTTIHGYSLFFASFLDIGRWRRARTPRALVRFVISDMTRVVIYPVFVVILIFALRGCLKLPNNRTYPNFAWMNSKGTSHSTISSSKTVFKDAGNLNVGKTVAIATSVLASSTSPRYVETDAMKAASARRKRIFTSRSLMSV